MAKAAQTRKPRVTKYDEELTVKPGSFLDIMNASVRMRRKNPPKRRKKNELL